MTKIIFGNKQLTFWDYKEINSLAILKMLEYATCVFSQNMKEKESSSLKGVPMNNGEMRSALLLMVALLIAGCDNRKQAESVEVSNTFLAMPEGKYCIKDVSEDDIAGLKDLLEAYFKDPETVGILLKAYTSMSGTIHQNRKAAHKRLHAVKQYLIDSGVPAAKIAIDYDPTPMSANKRGVELTIVPKSLIAEIRSVTKPKKPKTSKSAKAPEVPKEAAKEGTAKVASEVKSDDDGDNA